MLLVVDIGNTNTVLGVYEGEDLLHRWRVASDRSRTADEYAGVVANLFGLAGLQLEKIDGAIIASVVPELGATLATVCRRYLDCRPCIVGPDCVTGMPTRYDNPAEIGADRIVNAVAAYEKYRRALIVVDFGTATTLDCVSSDGVYLGGAIAPGLAVSADALFSRTSKLPRAKLEPPPRAIATSTVKSLQSGVFYGYIDMIDGLVRRMRAEIDAEPLVLATGGLAPVVVEHLAEFERIEPDLTLAGLRIIYLKNKQCFDTPGDGC